MTNVTTETLMVFFLLLWTTLILCFVLCIAFVSFRTCLGMYLVRMYRKQFMNDCMFWMSICGGLTCLPVCVREAFRHPSLRPN